MTDRNRKLVELLKRPNINICCVQETKWKGEKAKYIEHGSKIIYSGKTITRNVVEVLMEEKMKSKVIYVVGKSGKINF